MFVGYPCAQGLMGANRSDENMIEDDPQPRVRLMTPDEVEKHVKGLPLAAALEQFDWEDFWPVVDSDGVVVDVVCGWYPDQGILYPQNRYEFDEGRDVYVDPAEEE